jgi:hypothetical protein
MPSKFDYDDTGRKRLLARSLPLMLLLIADFSFGAWDTVPEVALLTEANDNPRLRRTAQQSDSSRVMLDARLAVTNFSDRGSIYLQPRVRASEYSNATDTDLEDEELFLRSYGRYNWQGASVGYTSNWSQQNIRNAEFRSSTPEDPDIPDPDDPGTGLDDNVAGDREAIWAAPYVELHVSDRNSIRLELLHNEVSYSGPAAIQRSDFRQNEFAAGIVRRVGEITQVTARVFASNFESDRNGNNTDTVGVEGKFVQPLGTAWTMDVSAGVQRNDFFFLQRATNDRVENADTNVTLALLLRRRADRARLNFSMARAISPNGSGFVSEVSEARVWLDQRFSERVTGTIGARVQRTKTLDSATKLNDRDYVRLDIGLRWALTERLFLTAGYNITDQEYADDLVGASQSNALYLGINYRGLSRQ